jgi:hypothetical protein
MNSRPVYTVVTDSCRVNAQFNGCLDTFFKMLAEYLSHLWLVRFVYLYSWNVVYVHDLKLTCNNENYVTLLRYLTVE